MIPQFPQFKKLELADRSDVEAFTKSFEPYSDFNFTCLWAWDVQEKRMISQLNGNLVIKFTTYNTHEPFLTFIGSNDCENTVRTLIDYAKSNELPMTLRLLPYVSIFNLDPITYSIEESKGDFDYILSIEKIAVLTGSEFQNKRTKANKFWRENPSAILKHINLSDETIQKQILDTINVWEQQKIIAQKEYDIDDELIATKRLFKSDCANSLLCIGLYSNSDMIGYAIAEKLTKGYAISHFQRGIISYSGVNEAIMQDFAKYLSSLQIAYYNFESDVDYPDMRLFKMSWRPVKFLKRYNVSIK